MKRHWIAWAGAAAVGGSAYLSAQTGPSGAAPCAPAALVTYEQGRVAAVDWVDYGAGRVHTKVIETRSHIVDATIDLRADGTAARSKVDVTTAGEEQRMGGMDMSQPRDLGAGAIYWSPRIPSSIEQAILRARSLGQPAVTIPGASLYSSSRYDVAVEKVDPTSWVVRALDREYDVVTDERGCVQSVTLPAYGVTIERRTDVPQAPYPLWTPYGPPPDHAYTATDVSIPASQGHVLAGTLTRPNGTAIVPAALVITGISPHERNNGDAPWMPFRDIADALTRSGIAVLRVDDRGIGKSTGDNKTMTIFDKLDDVRTEVAWLRAQQGIDGRRIALVGYSEGGLIAPMAAASDRAIAAIATLDGPGVSGMDVARYQVAQPILRDPKLSTDARAQEIEKQLKEALTDLTPHEKTFLSVDPIAYDRQVRCPALIIHGGTDATVPVRSAELMAAAMRRGGNSKVTVRIFPGVSHSLLPDPDGLSSGWAGLPAFFTSPPLLDALTAWMSKTLTPS